MERSAIRENPAFRFAASGRIVSGAEHADKGLAAAPLSRNSLRSRIKRPPSGRAIRDPGLRA
jgi:hypothetical protein